MADWQAGQYLKFKSERTQPAIDLVNRIDLANPTRIIDIGCGPGNSTAVLRERWHDAEIYGLDSSENMLFRAKKDFPDINWLLMDSNEDLSSLGGFDIIFSNAALQWMPEHEVLIPSLFQQLNHNGVLAVQVPFIRPLPVYNVIQNLINKAKWSEYFEMPPEYPKHFPFQHYYNIISKLTEHVQIWQTDYIHIMQSHEDIVEWYKGTGLRPFLERLSDDDLKNKFCSDYLELIRDAYPVEEDRNVLLPFTRIFFMACKD